jgi:hypothetical protein
MTSPLQQKLKVHGPVVITGNRLTDGAVVYRTADAGWSSDISIAAVATTAEHAKTLLAAAQSDYVNAVDPYVAPVELGEKIVPGNLRERIRLAGPTIPLPGA